MYVTVTAVAGSYPKERLLGKCPNLRLADIFSNSVVTPVPQFRTVVVLEIYEGAGAVFMKTATSDEA